MPWPLRTPDGDGYQSQDQPNLRRTPMEQGPDRVTRVSTQYETLINCSLLITAAELATYRTFYDGEAANGAGWFDMPILTSGTIQTHRVRINASGWTPESDDLFRLQLSLETDEQVP